MTINAPALLTRFCRELIAGDKFERKSLLGTADANQGDPAFAATVPGKWTHVTATGVLTMVALWEGQLSVDRLTPGDDEVSPDSTTLADLDDTDLTPAEVAEVQQIIRTTPLND